MLFSIKWLEEFLRTKLDVARLERVCLDLGLEIEDKMNYAPKDILIGKITAMKPHPREKNLEILNVRTKRAMQIVTAAKNIKQGDRVLVVPAGSKLKEQEITRKTFAGVKSEGILVSEQELGLAESSTGVIVLQNGRPGVYFSSHFDDLVVDISATPNRPDWLSLEGVAREISGSLGIDYSKLSSLDRMYAPIQRNKTGSFKIKIEDLSGCPRYTGRVFDDVRVAESPFWLKWRLHCMAMNGINNIVDITNLIMLLTGQPLHPFDADLLRGGIFIRKAKSGEKFVTLDGTILRLSTEDLVIADRDGPVALAGIIGAKRAQISSVTKNVVLESAYFDPKRIGHTARRLGIMTDASTRFERGGDIAVVDAASSMAGELFTLHAGCREREFIGQGKKFVPKTVRFSLPRLNEILSLELTAKQAKEILGKINIRVSGSRLLTARIPHYRRDIHIEEDIFEEVARVYGYERIPEIESKRCSSRAETNKANLYEEKIRNYLIGQGFDETYNLSLMSSKLLADTGYEQFVKIKNPLNERFDALRPTLLFGLLDTLNYNISKGNKSLRLFEMGNALLTKPPYQERRLGVVLGGHRNRDFWQKEEDKLDYFDAKGVVESVFEILHISDVNYKPANRKGFDHGLTIHVSGKELGFLGSLGTDLCKEPYYFFELTLEHLWDAIEDAFYTPPPKFPANTRDLSFVTDDKVQVPDMANAIARIGGPILERVVLFDFYKGKNLGPMKKSLGFRLHFRAPDRTLTDREVDIFVRRITEEVLKTFNASLRKKE